MLGVLWRRSAVEKSSDSERRTGPCSSRNWTSAVEVDHAHALADELRVGPMLRVLSEAVVDQDGELWREVEDLLLEARGLEVDVGVGLVAPGERELAAQELVEG